MSDKPIPTSNATVTTKVDLKPQGSQTWLVGFLVLSGLALILGAGLLGFSKDAGWGLIAFSALLAFISAWGWFVAHVDADLSDAKPTTISTPAGLTFSTDSRTLRSPTAADALALLIEASTRQKLPDADGIIENGVLVPNSADAANARVHQINQIVDDQARNVEILLAGRNGPTVDQRPSTTAIPPDNTTSLQNVVSHGQVGNDPPSAQDTVNQD